MKIRVATLLDIPQLAQFGAEFLKESPNYQDREYCHDQAAIHFTKLIKGAGVIFLAEHDGQICGGFAGGIGSDWFNQQKVAYDYVMYVQPKFRKTRAAYMLGTGADIEFENSGSFFFSKDDGAVIYPDFLNPLDFAIKSANYDKNGVLCVYDKFISGTELDNYTYSNTHNIKIKNLQIIAKNQIYGGLKLAASPQSDIR